MAEYILRSYIRKMAMFETRYTMETKTDATILLRMIEDAPAADVAPVVHGCWIEKPFLMGISRFCSKCGDNFGMPHGVYRYCPTCGARMDLEATDNE